MKNAGRQTMKKETEKLKDKKWHAEDNKEITRKTKSDKQRNKALFTLQGNLLSGAKRGEAKPSDVKKSGKAKTGKHKQIHHSLLRLIYDHKHSECSLSKIPFLN